MSRAFAGCAAAAALAMAAPLAAHAGNYPYGGHIYGGYDPGYSEAGYDRGGYGYGDRDEGYGYGYGGSPYDAPAHYCEEHLRYHEHQAWMNDQAPYNDWWGTGGPEAWHEAMEADHARFHYSHPGSWRCEYQGWPSG